MEADIYADLGDLGDPITDDMDTTVPESSTQYEDYGSHYSMILYYFTQRETKKIYKNFIIHIMIVDCFFIN